MRRFGLYILLFAGLVRFAAGQAPALPLSSDPAVVGFAQRCLQDVDGSTMRYGNLTIQGFNAAGTYSTTAQTTTINSGSMFPSLSIPNPTADSHAPLYYVVSLQSAATLNKTVYINLPLMLNDTLSGGRFTQFNFCKVNAVIGTYSGTVLTYTAKNIAGTFVWSGVGAPSSLVGSTGDLYTDTNSSMLYGPYSSGWPGGVNYNPSIGNVASVYTSSGSPTTACSTLLKGIPANDITNGVSYVCNGTTYKQTTGTQPSMNLSDLTNVSAARTNLGLGTAAVQPATAFLDDTGSNCIVKRTAAGVTSCAVAGTDYSLPSSVSNLRTITATGSATTTDHTINCDATAGNVVVTLPTTPATNQFLHFRKADSTANTCTLSAAALINGTTTMTLTTQYSSLNLQYDGVTGLTWGLY